MSNLKLTFVGLGVMGYPMAGFLQKKSLDVTVYYRTKLKSEKWKAEFGGHYSLTPGEAVKNSDISFFI